MTLQKEMSQKLENVQDKKMYSPEEIHALGLILGTKLKPSIHKLYRLIRNEILPATNMGEETQPRWFVLGKDLRKHIETKFIKNK